MFYTEYRPKSFSELIGTEHITTPISNSILAGNPSHAYFFSGSRGTGKTTLARIFSKAINCEIPIVDETKTAKLEPCNKCDTCVAINHGSYLDLIEIDAASNRGIDNIRELRENVKLSPSKGKYKIYIIDEVHMLTTEASNALLKTLEEPPSHAFFILCTTNPEKVLDTIKSRCIQFKFKKPNIQDLIFKLEKIAIDKGAKIGKENLKKIAIVAKGAFRDAETHLEQFIANKKDNFEDNQIRSIQFENLLAAIAQKDTKKALNIINETYSTETNLEEWIEDLISYLRSLLFTKLGVNLNEDQFSYFKPQVDLLENFTETRLKDLIQAFNNAHQNLRSTIIPTLPLEIAVIEIICDEHTNRNEEHKATKQSTQVSAIPLRIDKHVTNIELSLETKNEGANRTGVKAKKKETEVPNKKVIDKPASEKEVKLSKDFPYKKFSQLVKSQNQSVYLILHSCEMNRFDGMTLYLNAYYSFHKERIMNIKIKSMLEDIATKLTGHQIKLNCNLLTKNPKAKSLTDHNVKSIEKPMDIEDAFEKVFGSDMITPVD